MLETLDVNNVIAYYYVVKYMNFTKAAEHLCLTQSAVSTRIKKLEENLVVPLIVRNGRTFELTEIGELVMRFAEKIVESHSTLCYEIECVQRKNSSSSLKIGVTSILSELVVYNVLAKFLSDIYQKYQGIDIQTCEYVMASLKKESIDIAIIGHIGVVASKDIELLSLGNFENSIVVSSDVNSSTELKNKELIFLYDNVYAKESIYEYLAKVGITYRTVKEIKGNVYALLKMVESGQAFAVIPSYTLKQIGGQLNIKTLQVGENFYFNLCGVVRKNSPTYEKSKGFIHYIKEKVEDMGLLK
ncbi:MAG: LysR family transcriptional regulator [Fusobacteria bacterium]|nr:LysR family transcriptional regulator [Fusobacteriota bacterium]